MTDDIRPSEEVLRAERRFRVVIVLLLLLIIGAMIWAKTHTDHHRELHADLGEAVRRGNAAAPIDELDVRSLLGMVLQPVTPAMAELLGLVEARGILVGDVSPGTPADRAGVKRGDVIVELEGEPVDDGHELQTRISQKGRGAELGLGVKRAGHWQDLIIFVPTSPAAGQTETAASAVQGLSLQTLTPAFARRLHLPSDLRGALIAGVDPNSPWFVAGLVPGDVIEEVDRQPIDGAVAFEQIVSQSGREAVLLLVNRHGTSLFVIAESD